MPANQETLENILKGHKTLVVVGGNWGDEGKGKIIDKVLGFYDIAARFSGGANAGHTIFVGNPDATVGARKLVSHLIPCGLAQNKICVLGRGEFFNLDLFLKELEESKAVLGNEPIPPIYIDRQAPLWTPYHAWFETYVESLRGNAKIGTTNKGIGPLEGFYKLRLAPVVGYLFEPDLLKNSVEILYKVLEPSLKALKALDASVPDMPAPASVCDALLKQAGAIKEFVSDTAYFLQESLAQGKTILFEGAQATGLDARWGTYPFVSAGNSVAAGAAIGTGLSLSEFGSTILVAKTLPTRVGNGPMPSEMWERQAALDFAKEHGELFAKGAARDEYLSAMLEKINSGSAGNAEMSQYFQVLGDERGATTGRGRSVGFLDIPWLLYAIRINGPKWIALTRFDMLSKIKSIPVVVGYKYKGKMLPAGQLPAPWEMDKIETVKENWTGFEEDISGISDADKLPKNAAEFLVKLEKLLGVPILLVGTGPSREAIIVRP